MLYLIYWERMLIFSLCRHICLLDKCCIYRETVVDLSLVTMVEKLLLVWLPGAAVIVILHTPMFTFVSTTIVTGFNPPPAWAVNMSKVKRRGQMFSCNDKINYHFSRLRFILFCSVRKWGGGGGGYCQNIKLFYVILKVKLSEVVAEMTRT